MKKTICLLLAFLTPVAAQALEPSIALPADLARVLRDYEIAWSAMDACLTWTVIVSTACAVCVPIARAIMASSAMKSAGTVHLVTEIVLMAPLHPCGWNNGGPSVDADWCPTDRAQC